MTKNNVLVGKGYCDRGLFVLNVSEIVKDNEFSFAYMVDSVDLWHARLGHVNMSYVKKLQQLGIIVANSSTCPNKCEICVESKLTKKLVTLFNVNPNSLV